eukprot:gene22680-biopygen14798
MRPCGGPWPNTALQCNAESTHTDPSRPCDDISKSSQGHPCGDKTCGINVQECSSMVLCRWERHIQGNKRIEQRME